MKPGQFYPMRYAKDRVLPAPDWCRCDAIARPRGHWDPKAWNARIHRCGNYATSWRDGYQLCTHHHRQSHVRYAHGFRIVHEYARMMAIALGDEELSVC